jgi:hypothetical protein
VRDRLRPDLLTSTPRIDEYERLNEPVQGTHGAGADPDPSSVSIRESTRHSAETRERTVTPFAATEWLLFVNGALIESRLYHGARASAYASEFAG